MNRWERIIISLGLSLLIVRSEGADIFSGEKKNGSITVGVTNTFSLAVSAGDSVVARAGGVNFTPSVQILNATGALLDGSSSSSVNNRDGEAEYRAQANGVLTIAVSSYYVNGGGAYALSVVKSPGDIVTSAGDEGGSLVNGSRNLGIMNLGDIDVWSFDGAQGDSVVIRAGGVNFTPLLRLYAPDGTLLQQNTSSSVNNRDGEVEVRLASAGTFVLALSSYYLNGSGDYRLSFAKAPGTISIAAGDEGGPLTNGSRQPGLIETGDVDAWTFSGDAGDSVIVRAGGVNFTPLLRVFGPNGVLIGENLSSSVNNRDSEVAVRLTNSGPFVVLMSSYYLNGGGDYQVSFVKTPGTILIASGDQGGPLVNGTRHSGTISVGDLDAWTFSGDAGDAVIARAGGVNFTPLLRMYGPDGTLIAQNISSSVNNRDSEAAVRLTNSGPFVVVVSSYYQNGAGDYGLEFVKAPGVISIASADEGGSVTNGTAHQGRINVGDLDAWAFVGEAGNTVLLRAGGTTFTPLLRLYGPGGVLLGQNLSSSVNNRDAEMGVRLTNSGPHIVVLSSYYQNGLGDYKFSFLKTPGGIFVGEGDEGGGMTGADFYDGVVEVGDMDVFTFAGCIGDQVNFEMTGTNFTPWIRVYGPDGNLMRGTTSSSVNTRFASLAWTGTNCGTFTVVLGSYYLNGLGGYHFVAHGLMERLRLCPPVFSALDLKVFGVSGPPGADFTLYSAGDVGLPPGDWGRVMEAKYDGQGIFVYTNNALPFAQKQFYRMTIP